MELKDLKIGDKVALKRTYNSPIIERIEDITPKGYIKINGCLFSPDTGYMRGRGAWDFTSIKVLTPEIEELIKQNEIIYKAQQMLRKFTMTYEKAVKIIEALKED